MGKGGGGVFMLSNSLVKVFRSRALQPTFKFRRGTAYSVGWAHHLLAWLQWRQGYGQGLARVRMGENNGGQGFGKCQD